MAAPAQSPASQPAQAEAWLLELASLPTAAGREDVVIDWIQAWSQRRRSVELTRDSAGNMLLRAAQAKPGKAPLVFAAHLDHPAFVIEERPREGAVHAAFRGGVKTPYFHDARVVVHTRAGERLPAVVKSASEPDPYRDCVLALRQGESAVAVAPGNIAVWDLPEARIVESGERGRMLEAPACDDLAAVAAALAAFDALLGSGAAAERDARLLFTRAEEIGFVGAIAACKRGSIPQGSRVIALENSRSFADSPLGAGPIVRVGDRVSTFSPALTADCAKTAQRLADERDDFRWQRKLMPGGACEASAYCAFGYEATCLCLPLENYHNMGELERIEAALEAGETPESAPLAPERISLADFHNLVALLVALGESLEPAPPLIERFERLYEERKSVLERDGGR